MIDFTNVRLEKDETYIFTTNMCAEYIEWAFADAGITDYTIESLNKIRDQLPKHILIPEFIPIIHGDPNAPNCRKPVVLISHMNVDDLSEKLIEINNATDIDLRARIDAERAESLENFKTCHEPYLKT